MRSIAFALLIFAGILAYGNAAPQLNLAWLQEILAEAGQRNTTVKFGNNTVIISGVSNAVANSNDGTIRPTPPQGPWNNYRPPYDGLYGYNGYNGYNSYDGYNGYYRMVPTIDGQIVEEPQSSLEESHELSQDQSDDESGEDEYQQEYQTEELEDVNIVYISEDELNELVRDQLDDEEEAEDGLHDQSEEDSQEDNENDNELVDLN